MHTIYKCLIIATVMSFSFLAKVNAQTAGKTPYREGSREQRQIQTLIDRSIPYAEKMLVKQGAYVPPYT